MGIDSADSHHTTNAMVLDPGGATYLSDGVFHRTQVETPLGAARPQQRRLHFSLRAANAESSSATSRYGFANPHGRVFDRWGNDIITDATGNANYLRPGLQRLHRVSATSTPACREFWNRPSRPCPGTGMVSSRHFPDDWQGNFLNCNVIGFQGIFRAKVTEEGSGLNGETIEDLIKSSDPNFRPTAVSCAPGRLDLLPRLAASSSSATCSTTSATPTATSRTAASIASRTKAGRCSRRRRSTASRSRRCSNCSSRRRTTFARGRRSSWASTIRPKSSPRPRSGRPASTRTIPSYEHHMIEALWVHQWHNVVDQGLLERMLDVARSPRPGRRRSRAVLLARPRSERARPAARSSPPIRIRASAWKRCGPPASSRSPKRSRCR